MPAIAFSHLTKRYGHSKVAAVSDVSLTIKPGEVYGFLGANGAGKSTSLRTAMGFLRPTSGSVKLLGKTVSDRNVAVRQDVGYLPGDVVLPKGATGHKLLAYLRTIRTIGPAVDSDYQNQLAERFEAELNKPVDQLSKGNRQKIGLIQAFMHQPKVLILDEPTSGLDPLMQEQFYKTIKEARQRQVAILMSSHNFDEVERVCDRVGIIREGRLVYEGSVAQISAASLPRWRVILKDGTDAKKLAANPAVKVLTSSKEVVVLQPTKSIQEALGVLAKFPIMSMTTYQRELEEEFMNFYTAGQEKRI